VKRRRQDKKVDILISIFKRPEKLEIVVRDSLGSSFGNADAKKVRDILVADFKKRDFDQGLVSGLQYVQNKLQANPPKKSDTGPGKKTTGTGKRVGTGDDKEDDAQVSIMGWICIALGALLVIWLIVGIIRAITAPRPVYGGGPGGGPGYGGGYGGGGGGGFFT